MIEARKLITIKVYNETEWTRKEITFGIKNIGLTTHSKKVPVPVTTGSGKPRTVSWFMRQFDLEPYIKFDLEPYNIIGSGIDGAKGSQQVAKDATPMTRQRIRLQHCHPAELSPCRMCALSGLLLYHTPLGSLRGGSGWAGRNLPTPSALFGL
jgi:hypothetical protein